MKEKSINKDLRIEIIAGVSEDLAAFCAQELLDLAHCLLHHFLVLEGSVLHEDGIAGRSLPVFHLRKCSLLVNDHMS